MHALLYTTEGIIRILACDPNTYLCIVIIMIVVCCAVDDGARVLCEAVGTRRKSYARAVSVDRFEEAVRQRSESGSKMAVDGHSVSEIVR